MFGVQCFLSVVTNCDFENHWVKSEISPHYFSSIRNVTKLDMI